MVKIMAPPAPGKQSAREDHCGEEGQFDAVARESIVSNALGGSELPMDASTCIFWCAVAVGALVKGIPTESVRFGVLAYCFRVGLSLPVL